MRRDRRSGTALRKWPAYPLFIGAVGAPFALRSNAMTADTFRTVSTCFAAMFVSVLLVAASTSTALVA